MKKRMQVLLVEDNPGDADLTRESLASSSFSIELTVAANGMEALDCLHRRGKFAASATPDLILLDLNLPGIDGRGVLAEIKQHPEFRRVPVTILTSSTSEKDIDLSYEIGANCYIVKPLDYRSFQAIMRALEHFWFSIVRLPRARGSR
ncbi:MAG TPA: response regulator [Candidatus Aquilonibacter sp.]|nr:response regulator [Candidatus Aquilonibacter sp.]